MSDTVLMEVVEGTMDINAIRETVALSGAGGEFSCSINLTVLIE
jgi:hypothetical protein